MALTVKKLFVADLLILATLPFLVIIPDYYYSYPVSTVAYALGNVEWVIFLGIIAAGAALSGFLSAILLRRIAYSLRFLSINVLFNSAFFILILIKSIPYLIESNIEYKRLSSEYIRRADSDIKNGLIVYESFGLPIVSDPIEETQIDSIRSAYGIIVNNAGCMITGPLLKAQADYQKLTAPFLDKRNGLGWRLRMDLKIDEIRRR